MAATAETINVAENDIRSLANAPAVLDIAPAADHDGRPALLAQLRFANSCLADAGAVALAGTPPDGLAHLAILQHDTPDGCPDIFQPTDRQALIEPGVDAGELRLIAKPAARDGLRSLELDPAGAAAAAGTPVVATQAFGPDAALPAFEVRTATAVDGGYMIAGVASIGQECDSTSIRTLVYEVPDGEGTPRYDVIVLTAPQSCAAGARRLDLEVRVSRPVAGGWRVYIANEARPALRPVD